LPRLRSRDIGAAMACASPDGRAMARIDIEMKLAVSEAWCGELGFNV